MSAQAPSSLAAVAMAVLFGVALFGMPRFARNRSLETALQDTTRQIAAGEAHQALTILLPLRESHSQVPLVDRQIARAYAALNRPSDEAAAWERFLRKSPVVGDGCQRLREIHRSQSLALHPAHSPSILEWCSGLDPDQPAPLASMPSHTATHR